MDQSSSTDPDTTVDTTDTSKSYTDEADGTWHFHVRAKDSVGNWGATDHYRLRIDDSAPDAPTVSSSTHPDEDAWYTSDDPSFSWTTPSDTSGIAGYSHVLDQSSSTDPDTTVDTTDTSKSYSDEPDGTWYFHVRAKDSAGSWGATDHYRVKLDDSDPDAPTISSSTHPDEDAWYTSDDPVFSWTIPSDTSGVAGYSYVLDQSSSTDPDTVVDTTGTSKSYNNVPTGTNYFHVRARDNAGNWGSTDHFRAQIRDEPEISVDGNSTSIPDGDTTPIVADGTEFGSADIRTGSVVHTFTIHNAGSADLTLTGTAPDFVAISGSGAFTVTAQPSSATVGAGGSTTFGVTFDPATAEGHTATISISNDDSDEDPYTFDVHGTGTSGPEIDVQGRSTSIPDGDTTPIVADDTEFGSADVSTDSVVHTFTIHNAGSADLTLTGTAPNFVAISGSGAFTVTAQPSSATVSAGASTTFQVTFDPAAVAVHTATVSIANNDSDEDPYEFSVRGQGVDGVAYHAADTNRNWRIEAAEVIRVLTLYNKNKYYACDPVGGTVDGYVPSDGQADIPDGLHHDADTNRNGRIEANEVIRAITLYNKNGYYRVDQNGTSADGFVPSDVDPSSR